MANGDYTFTRQGTKVLMDIEGGIAKQINLRDSEIGMNEERTEILIYEKGQPTFSGITNQNIIGITAGSTPELFSILSGEGGIFFCDF